jgi:uncharacterized protein
VKLVVDTNVFISGVFFSGPPYEILNAWRNGKVQLVISPEIIEEYRATGHELSSQFPDIDIAPWIELIATIGLLVKAPALPAQVCTDIDDDKFLACAVAARCKYLITGDKALLATSGFRGVRVLTPRQFIDAHLK